MPNAIRYGRLISRTLLFTAVALLTTAVLAPRTLAQSYTVLHRFAGFPAEGKNPNGGLVRDAAGNLYGTTSRGGAYGVGTIFKLDKSGKETVLFNFFKGTILDDGYTPTAGLIEDNSGNLYGTTYQGGDPNCYIDPRGCGTVFKLDATGKLTVLHRFHGSDGIRGPDGMGPDAVLVMDQSGNIYGTTDEGGPGQCISNPGCGTVFKLDRSGKVTILDGITASYDTAEPNGLLLDKSGTLYGTSASVVQYEGEITCCGTIFKIDVNGSKSILYSFTDQADGAVPTGMIRDGAGNLYGAAAFGGNTNCQIGFGCGTVYKLDTSGQLTVLYSFTGGTDGEGPESLIRDGAGNFYGLTYRGGGSVACNNGCGTVFKLSPSGKETVLHRFTGGSDGSGPTGIILGSDGNLYGSAWAGGSFPPFCSGTPPGCGVVFKVVP